MDTFRIWDYPMFSVLLGYVWLEMANPLLGSALQIIPKIPNSAIALVLCYNYEPNFIKQIRMPFNPVKWALPFLIIATINLPFVELEQYRSVIEMISTWFWVLIRLPLMIRVLVTQSGRWHFALFSIVGLVALVLHYYLAYYIFKYHDPKHGLSYHHISGSVIAIFPILLGYIYLKKGFTKFFLILALTIVLLIAIPAGARIIWLILPIEFLLMVLFVLPKMRLVISGMVVLSALSFFLSFWNISDIYSNSVFDQLEIRKRKAVHWQDDNTVWKRFGMVIKTKMILEEHPLLGVGYSNRSFSAFDAGDVDFLGREAKVRKIDAHNTYLNLLGGTGILGFMAFIYYLWKVVTVFRKTQKQLMKRPDWSIFLISTGCVFLTYFFSNVPFSAITSNTAIIFALYIYQYNMQSINDSGARDKLI